MIYHEVRIPYSYGQSIKIKPLFDAHVGDKFCDVKALKSYLSDSDENTYLLLGGDWETGIITRDIKRYLKHCDATEEDDILDAELNMVCDILKVYKGQYLGVMIGNHEGSALKYHATHLGRRLANRLDTRSLGYSCVIKLLFNEGIKSGKPSRGRTVLLYAHHGFGGGSRTAGGDITKYTRHASSWDCDIFLYGHVHRLQSDKVDRMKVVGSRIVSAPKHVYICGTFQKTFSDSDIPTFAEERGFPPVSIGAPNIFIRPDTSWVTIDSDVT